MQIVTVMVKKLKDADNQQISPGCICPIQNGCTVRQPIDPANLPADAVKIVCSNGEKCKQILYVHGTCFETWCESLIKDYKALGSRARNDARMERFYAVNRDHIWGSHAYGKLSRFCKCPCGGTLKKNIELGQTKEKPQPNSVPVLPTAATKKPKKPVLVVKKFKGPSVKVYNDLIGPTGFSNKNAIRINRLNRNSESFSVDVDDETKSSPDALPYIPPGLYALDKAAGGDQSETFLRKVDNSVNVIGVQKNKSSPNDAVANDQHQRSSSLSKQARPTTASDQQWRSLKPINTEDGLLGELNSLFEQVPEDLSRDQLTDMVNTILDRADVFVLSTIADIGGVWEWLKQKADEELESSDNDDQDQDQDQSDADVDGIINEGEESCFDFMEGISRVPSSALGHLMLVPDELNNFVGFSAAFCYRESVAHIESLMKSMNVMTKK